MDVQGVPAEIARLALVVYLADWLSRKRDTLGDYVHGFLPPVLVTLVMTVLVLKQPSMGGAIAIFALGLSLLFLAGARVKHILLDKTGTLTRGNMAVVGVEADGIAADEALAWVATLETASEHPVGKAIVAALEHNGFDVLLPEQNCCGLPMQSNGDFAGAHKYAEANLRKLTPYARQGIPIVVGGSSCGLELPRPAS